MKHFLDHEVCVESKYSWSWLYFKGQNHIQNSNCNTDSKQKAMNSSWISSSCAESSTLYLSRVTNSCLYRKRIHGVVAYVYKSNYIPHPPNYKIGRAQFRRNPNPTQCFPSDRTTRRCGPVHNSSLCGSLLLQRWHPPHPKGIQLAHWELKSELLGCRLSLFTWNALICANGFSSMFAFIPWSMAAAAVAAATAVCQIYVELVNVGQEWTLYDMLPFFDTISTLIYGRYG